MTEKFSNSNESNAEGLILVETDEAGKIITRYSPNATSSTTNAPALSVLPVKEAELGYLKALINIFLPAGYPQSVTDDYLPYQIYDSLQAFSSAIAGLLSSRALLQGSGVGDANASASNAVLVNILQDSVGRLATIMFAHRLGSSLEPECKRYRFLADIFNDTTFILDCISPVLPKSTRVTLLCFSSCLRAMCGVAAGASKASLSVHFARWGTVAELNAKDSSQETVIGLMGMLAGSFVVSKISSTWATWTSMLFLIAVHLYTNYCAVRAVTMDTFNRQRANILISAYIDHNTLLSLQQVAQAERIFERDGQLRWGDDKIYGKATIGAPFSHLYQLLKETSPTTDVPTLLRTFEKEGYILWFSVRQKYGVITLKTESTPRDQLKAWIHMLLLAKAAQSEESVMLSLSATGEKVNDMFPSFLSEAQQCNWKVESMALESTSGFRLNSIQDVNKKTQ